MGIEIKKQAGTTAGTPSSPNKVNLGVDTDGNPYLKDSSGRVRTAVSLDGSPVELIEQGSAPAAENDKGKLYTKDVSGATELFYRDDLANGGNEVQLTSAGSVAGAAPLGTLSPYVGNLSSSSIVQVNYTGTSLDQVLNFDIGLPFAVNNSLVQFFIGVTGHNVAGSQDAGYLVKVGMWGTAPTYPASFGVGDFAIVTEDSVGSILNFEPMITAITITSASTATITINSASSFEGSIQISVLPEVAVSTDPTLVL